MDRRRLRTFLPESGLASWATIAAAILRWGSDDPTTPSRPDDIAYLTKHKTASHVLQSICRVPPPQMWEGLFGGVFTKERIFEAIEHVAANHVLSALIDSSPSKKHLRELLDRCGDSFAAVCLRQNRIQLLIAAARATNAVGSKEAGATLCRGLSRAIGGANGKKARLGAVLAGYANEGEGERERKEEGEGESGKRGEEEEDTEEDMQWEHDLDEGNAGVTANGCALASEVRRDYR